MLPELAAHEDSFQRRLEQDSDVKVRLARAVAAMLTPNESIFIDSSSSAYYVVREIVEIGIPVTLLTNSLPVMTMVGASNIPQIDLIGIGGSFRTLTEVGVACRPGSEVRRAGPERHRSRGAG